MYLNSGGLLHNGQNNSNNLLVPQPEPFSRSHSDAANNNAIPRQDPNYLTDDMNGVRMKRYNSLPDVAEYLDPNVSEPPMSSSMMNNYPNPQLDSLMAAFSQGQPRKNFTKPYFDNQAMNDPRLQASHLSVPMSANLSTSSSMYHSPIPPSPQVSSHMGGMNHQDQSQFGWNSSARSPQQEINSHSFDNSGFQNRKRPMEHDDHLSQNYNYPNSQLGYPNEPMSSLSVMDVMNPNQMAPSSPNFQHQQQQQAMYMPQNPFKRMRPEHGMENVFDNYMPPPQSMYNMPNPMSEMGLVVPMQPAPAPDSATSQAACDAIAAASHCPPPSDESGDPDMVPRRQHLRYPGDLYTPQWVRGTGHKKEGYCDLCSPGKWLQLKNSAYWYHKQFFHGISSVSGKFFCGPVQTRQKDPDVIEGLCHQCHSWVQMSSAKRRNSVLWFRHAHKCHVYHKPKNVYGKKD